MQGAVGGGFPAAKVPGRVAAATAPPALDRGWAGDGGPGQQEPPTRSEDSLQRAGEVALRQEDLITFPPACA